MKSTRKISSRIGVVGGGAAGMLAAAVAAENGADVTLFEKNDRLGLKLGITGKGRCNLTNNCSVNEFIENVPVGGKFLYSALNAYSPTDVMERFERFGVPLKTERGNRVYPCSDRAMDVVFAMKTMLQTAGVKVVHSAVSGIDADSGAVRGLICGKKRYCFDAVILATGGLSYPKTGSTGDGYGMAQKLGHTIVTPKPSLIPLETEGDLAQSLQGLSLRNVAVYMKDTQSGKVVFEDFGEMLFTHFGISGPLVLSASSHIRNISRGKYEFHIDLKPAIPEKELDARVLGDFAKYKNKDLINAMHDLLPVKMILPFIKLCGIPERTKVNSVDREQRRRIVSFLKDMPLTIRGTRDISEAVITSGGISLKQIDPATMESKLVKGLYFAGEIIDADAYTGGFNLQIAFSTAYLAATSAVKNRRTEMSIINIAIDGPSGAGKSTLAKAFAAKHGYIYVDTGALYRAIGLFASRSGLPVDDVSGIADMLSKIKLDIVFEDGEQKVILNGENVNGLIRTPEISMYASAVSAVGKVREFLLDLQRDIAKNNNVVMDGRDIGTVILPNADVKIFLSATAEARAKRRLADLLAKGVDTTYEKVLSDMLKRDENDSGRDIAPLAAAPDSVLLDNSEETLEESLAHLEKIAEERLGHAL